MPINLDLTNADDSFGEWVALPDGTYNARIVSVEMRASKGGGKLPANTPGLNVRFEIDSEDLPETDPISGEKVNWSKNVFKWYAIAPKKYEKKQQLDNMLYGFLKCAGLDVEEMKSNPSFELDPDDLAGRRVQVVLERQTYTGNDGEDKERSQVRYVKAPGATADLV